MTSRFTRLLLTLCPAFCLALGAAPAAAQDVIDSTLSDLNGDGMAERFTLLHYRDAARADLIIEDTGTGRITARRVVWIGGAGQEPELDRAPNGSVRLISMNESIGRNRWRQTLTIAYRQGAYMVAGFTYDWYDTLDLGAAGRCDLNLLNGKGFLTEGQGPKRAIRHSEPPRPITTWTEDSPVPAICRSQEMSGPAGGSTPRPPEVFAAR